MVYIVLLWKSKIIRLWQRAWVAGIELISHANVEDLAFVVPCKLQ